MALSRLEEHASFYLSKGVAPNTARAYKSAQSRYWAFCARFSLPPLPASEQTLILFVAELAQDLAHSTIRSYLSGVRNLHITNGLPDPLPGSFRLNLVLNGIRRVKAHPPKVKIPVTPLVLHRLRKVFLSTQADVNKAMMWAACCVGFYGFLRTAEFTVPNGKFDPSCHLAVKDVAIDCHTSPSLLQIRIKMSKTDQYKHGTFVYMATTHNELCPVAAVLSYLVHHPSGEGPLFQFRDGSPLTRARFVLEFRKALSSAGVQADGYTGHSFRIGAATTAAAKGIPDNMIKALGRWTSEAYQIYIRLPREQLASVTAMLAL